MKSHNVAGVNKGERRVGRKKAAAMTLALTGIGGAAFAYWTMSGTGSGTAGTGTTEASLVVSQAAPTGDLGPGLAPLALSGTIANPNEESVHVAALKPVVSVTPLAGKTCAASNYALGGAGYDATSGELAVDAQVDGAGSLAWSGLTIGFVNDPDTNQDGCKGATVTIDYTVA